MHMHCQFMLNCPWSHINMSINWTIIVFSGETAVTLDNYDQAIGCVWKHQLLNIQETCKIHKRKVCFSVDFLLLSQVVKLYANCCHEATHVISCVTLITVGERQIESSQSHGWTRVEQNETWASGKRQPGNWSTQKERVSILISNLRTLDESVASLTTCHLNPFDLDGNLVKSS